MFRREHVLLPESMCSGGWKQPSSHHPEEDIL
jgi:hypothetical protein